MIARWRRVALVLALMPLAGFGDGRDADKPIDYSADRSEVFRDGRAILEGNVVLIQGETRLTSDKLTIYFHSKDEKAPPGKTQAAKTESASGAGDGVASGGFYRYIAEGHVFASAPDETASGSKGVYEVEGKLLTMTGDVVLTRGKNVLRGKKLVIEVASGRSRLDPDENGRVRGLFVPEDSKPQGPKK